MLSHGTLSRRDPRPLTDRKPGLLRSWWHVAFWAGWGLLFWAVVAAAVWISTR